VLEKKSIKIIPERLHKDIHTGGYGGAYNARFLIEIKRVKKSDDNGKITEEITVEQVLKIRDMLVKEFGL
jgi:GTPase involved in cell partitioning and DNA repair